MPSETFYFGFVSDVLGPFCILKNHYHLIMCLFVHWWNGGATWIDHYVCKFCQTKFSNKLLLHIFCHCSFITRNRTITLQSIFAEKCRVQHLQFSFWAAACVLLEGNFYTMLLIIISNYHITICRYRNFRYSFAPVEVESCPAKPNFDAMDHLYDPALA